MLLSYYSIYLFCRKQDASRHLSSTAQLSRRSEPLNDEEEEKDPGPVKFTSSKASHRTWSVDQSLGSHFQRPWWNVLPISLIGLAILLWCFLREESDIDRELERSLSERFESQQPAQTETSKPEENSKPR
ncbi:protein CCSMST1 [Huso huso]|uniref:Protein CCSMST1 n=1 Tax=Huso huso TaxID=61971 RepID=A0ABR0YVK7_HUSHU